MGAKENMNDRTFACLSEAGRRATISACGPNAPSIAVEPVLVVERKTNPNSGTANMTGGYRSGEPEQSRSASHRANPVNAGSGDEAGLAQNPHPKG